MNPKQIFFEFLKNNKLMQLATVANGQPWLCNVYYVHDEDGNLYWTSARGKRRHSVEIVNDKKVAVTVVNDEDKKQAVQMVGEAFEVSLEESEKVDTLYENKYGGKDRLEEVKQNLPEGRAYWVVKPSEIYLWDEVNFPGSPKQKVDLNKE